MTVGQYDITVRVEGKGLASDTTSVRGDVRPTITAVSGAINRIPYSMAFRPGFEHTAAMNLRLANQAITDVGQSEMVAWIQQKYQCPAGVAVQVGVPEVLPFLYSTLIIYIVSWMVTVLLRTREAAAEEAITEP
jgi:hypothetical protein